MPTRFLSHAELASLARFPAAIEPEELAAHFRLDADELRFVREQRGAAGQLGIALQLCALRWLGFVPEDLAGAPPDALEQLAAQLDAPARAIFDYGVRERTRRDHHAAVRDRLGFRAPAEPELAWLRDWLVAEAVEHDKPTLLFDRACGELRARRVERPTPDRLARLVAWARERAHEQTFELLTPQLSDPVVGALDNLLVADPGRSGRTPLSWLRSRPSSVSAGALGRELQKRAYLHETVGAHRLDLSMLPPSRRAWLGQLGRRATNQALARLDPVRRYPVLVCFCAETLERATDDALEVFDRALGRIDRRAQREQQDLRRRHGRHTDATVRRFIDLARILLEARASYADPLLLIDRRIGLDQLRTELAQAERIVRPAGDDHLDLLLTNGTQVRGMLRDLLDALAFHAAADQERELLAALRLLRELAGGKQRWLPGFSPSGFIDRHWRRLVADTSTGRLDRRGYELCAAFELRSALRSGRVWVAGSRRHADPASYLLPPERWQETRVEFARAAGRPLTPETRLDELAAEQAELVDRLETAMTAAAGVELQDGELHVTDTREDHDTCPLADRVAERLPKVELAEVVIEVDRWTRFTDHFSGRGDQPFGRPTPVAVRGDSRPSDQRPPDRHGRRVRPHLRPARMGIGVVPARRDPLGGKRVPRRPPSRPAARSLVGRRAPLLLRWAALCDQREGPGSRGAPTLFRSPPPRRAVLLLDL